VGTSVTGPEVCALPPSQAQHLLTVFHLADDKPGPATIFCLAEDKK